MSSPTPTTSHTHTPSTNNTPCTTTPSTNNISCTTTPSTNTSSHDVVEISRSDLITVKDTDYKTDKHLILCGKCRGVLNISSYSCICELDSDAARAA
ncbi:unnamed protein product [Fusarium graminearum]|uniref:Chromosome 1, complete genome n=2 Tax=Gibberella zeae TaxID=5518 RepID=A0A0E0RX20_GIBZE|nr:hypothetical protein FG05_35144 [Fusarium graminearum]CAF3519773.1 unnamed protein product [Fusarium graminearum]CAF3613892.1 unnamed protein product [Fusarium graminearum]CAG1972852.1 unnamed protein product [Fusarium graminearum]CAG1999097.1 unnamed protein product [Fusarium graminearum]